MSNKLEQMNIRLSEKMKDRITEIAKKNNLKTSDFVRQTLEDAIEGKSKAQESDLFKSNFSNQERLMLQAAAFIVHTDTGKPLIDCLKTALEVAEEQKFTGITNPVKFSREEREKLTLNLNEIVAKRLKVSPQALTYIRLMLTTYLGIIYNQDIFQLTPLSMKTMEEIKEHLDKEKSFMKK